MSQIQSPSKLLKILVVDDHEAVIGGTIDAINKQYPEASVFQAKTFDIFFNLTNPEVLNRDRLRALVLGLTEASRIDGRKFAPLPNVEQEISQVQDVLTQSKEFFDRS